jgi:hypothetical protein
MFIIDYLKSFSPLEFANAMVCMCISLRLMIFRQGKSAHKLSYSFLAYILIVASAAISIRILMKHYVHVDLWEVILNSTVLVAVISSKGNIARIVRLELK